MNESGLEPNKTNRRVSRTLYLKNFKSSSFIKDPNQAPHYDPYKTQYRFDCFPTYSTGPNLKSDDLIDTFSSDSQLFHSQNKNSRPKYILPTNNENENDLVNDRSQYSSLEKLDKKIFKTHLDHQVAEKKLSKLIQEKENKAYELAMVKQYPFGKPTYEQFKYSKYIPDFTSPRNQESPREETNSKKLEYSRWSDWPSKPGAGVISQENQSNEAPDSPRTSVSTVNSITRRRSDVFNPLTRQKLYTKEWDANPIKSQYQFSSPSQDNLSLSTIKPNSFAPQYNYELNDNFYKNFKQKKNDLSPEYSDSLPKISMYDKMNENFNYSRYRPNFDTNESQSYNDFNTTDTFKAKSINSELFPFNRKVFRNSLTRQVMFTKGSRRSNHSNNFENIFSTY